MIDKSIWFNLHNENNIKASLKGGTFSRYNSLKKDNFFWLLLDTGGQDDTAADGSRSGRAGRRTDHPSERTEDRLSSAESGISGGSDDPVLY